MIYETQKNGFHLLRFKAAVDNPLLSVDGVPTAATTFSINAKPTNAVSINSLDTNYIQIIGALQGAENDSAVVNLYAGRKGFAPIDLVAQLTFTAGTSEVVYDPETGVVQGTGTGINDMDLYCDTIAITNDWWLTSCDIGANQGLNAVASFLFDSLGYDWLFAELKTLNDTAAAIKLWWSYL